MSQDEVVVTGLGVISPVGVGKARVWDAFRTGRSGVGPIRGFDASGLPVRIASEIEDFDPKRYVRPRKNLKVMARDAQLGVSASVLACDDAGLAPGQVAPERFGVVLGADRICGTMEDCIPPYEKCTIDGRFDFGRWAPDGIPATFPLSFLKVLPNMIASHISIAHDARGPNNTIHQAELSSLLAISEAARVIQRGVADVMLAGGASSQMNPFDWVRHCVCGMLSTSRADPSSVLRPFDVDRSGQVWGEGAAVLVIESRRHAEARGANLLGRLLGWASAFCPENGIPGRDAGLKRAMMTALENAGLGENELGHINAHGASSVADDRTEAEAIHDCLANVPVTAPKSYFGNLGAASGVVEATASFASFEEGAIVPTLNCRRLDPRCRVRIVSGSPVAARRNTAMVVNSTPFGQAAAVVFSKVE